MCLQPCDRLSSSLFPAQTLWHICHCCVERPYPNHTNFNNLQNTDLCLGRFEFYFRKNFSAAPKTACKFVRGGAHGTWNAEPPMQLATWPYHFFTKLVCTLVNMAHQMLQQWHGKRCRSIQKEAIQHCKELRKRHTIPAVLIHPWGRGKEKIVQHFLKDSCFVKGMQLKIDSHCVLLA